MNPSKRRWCKYIQINVLTYVVILIVEYQMTNTIDMLNNARDDT
jgi:hypothetical protein